MRGRDAAPLRNLVMRERATVMDEVMEVLMTETEAARETLSVGATTVCSLVCITMRKTIVVRNQNQQQQQQLGNHIPPNLFSHNKVSDVLVETMESEGAVLLRTLAMRERVTVTGERMAASMMETEGARGTLSVAATTA